MSFSFSRLMNGVGKTVLGDDLGNAVLGTVGYADDQIAAKENWRWQRKASDYAFNQNLEMWNLQNAYNDPSAQMERLKNAGLNPNLVYGGGSVTGNTSGSAPTYERPNVSYEDKSIQRKQLSLALKEHQQRITNQAIQNELARQRLVLSERDAERQDALARAQIDAYKSLIGYRDWEKDKPGPIAQGLKDVNNSVSSYSQPIQKFVGKLVDMVYPTRKPSEAFEKAKRSSGQWKYNFVTHQRYWSRGS